ncbi:MAG: DUF1738 domain-containing protein, partial [Clostridia bacterium]|nr:DUF1738 domain-containing protein [Clostridia bacterium]
MKRPTNRDEYRRELAETFAGILEEKGLEWKKEWQGDAGIPENGITRAAYRGCNAFALSLASMVNGYNDSRWATMTQIVDKGNRYHPGEKWQLKQGSKPAYVEYWYPYDILRKKALTWEAYRAEMNSGRSAKDFTFHTVYKEVFNAADIEGFPQKEQAKAKDIPQDELVGRLADAMGVEIEMDGGNEAYYSAQQDTIHLPAADVFDNDYAFNSTALHELSHSTGHPSRLNRPQSALFGTEQYAYEELVAEMCSCFMGAELRMQPSERQMENH